MSQTTNNKRKNWLVSLLIIIFVVILAVLVGYFYLNKGKTTSTPSVTKTIPVSVAAVTITKDGFTPSTIQVERGITVTWTNTDSATHQVVTDPHPGHTNLKDLDSDPLNQGDSSSFTFENTGTFTYHDEMNPLRFKGPVIVK
jgi:plastocyanin